MVAVIPAITVEDISGIKNIADCFVHVSNINTTFYIDDKHRMIITWAGPVEANDYDYENNPLNLRSQVVYDFENDRAVYYNKIGEYKIFALSSSVDGPTLNSILANGNEATNKVAKFVDSENEDNFVAVSNGYVSGQETTEAGTAAFRSTSDGSFFLDLQKAGGGLSTFQVDLTSGIPVVTMSDDVKDAFKAALGIE